MRSSFSDSGTTVCMDIDWVVGGCMSIDPDNDRDPVRVDCNDALGAQPAARHPDLAAASRTSTSARAASATPYDERQFTVCVEDVS